MNLRPGDVVLARIRFHQAEGGKVRPAVVVLDPGDADFVAAPVTSQRRDSEFDLPLAEWPEAGLNVASTARLHKLAVLPKMDVLRVLGKLGSGDFERFASLLCRAYCWHRVKED